MLWKTMSYLPLDNYLFLEIAIPLCIHANVGFCLME